MTHEAPDMNFEMTYTVRTTNPLEPTAGAPFGAKQFWQVSEATLDELESRPNWPAPAWTGCR